MSVHRSTIHYSILRQQLISIMATPCDKITPNACQGQRYNVIQIKKATRRMREHYICIMTSNSCQIMILHVTDTIIILYLIA